MTVQKVNVLLFKTFNMTKIKQLEKSITKIWDELNPLIEGTGASSLIEELIALEIELEQECNK